MSFTPPTKPATPVTFTGTGSGYGIYATGGGTGYGITITGGGLGPTNPYSTTSWAGSPGLTADEVYVPLIPSEEELRLKELEELRAVKIKDEDTFMGLGRHVLLQIIKSSFKDDRWRYLLEEEDYDRQCNTNAGFKESSGYFTRTDVEE